MHGDKFKKVVGHTIKQERLQKRLVAKSARRERKQRVKAIKHDLVDMLEGKALCVKRSGQVGVTEHLTELEIRTFTTYFSLGRL